MIPEPNWLRSLEDDRRPQMEKVFRARISALLAGPAETPDGRARYRGQFRGSRWGVGLPKWTAKSQVHRLHFLIRLAALYAAESGSMSALALACGCKSRRAFSTYCALKSGRGRLSAPLCKAVEIVTNGAVTREMLNPEIFT